jgi:hypothetical protein
MKYEVGPYYIPIYVNLWLIPANRTEAGRVGAGTAKSDTRMRCHCIALLTTTNRLPTVIGIPRNAQS